MKKTFIFLILFSLVTGLFACSQNPPPVSEEEKQKAISLAKSVYEAIKKNPASMAQAGVKWEDGFCLANVLMDDWVADLVHNPRQPVDDDPKNQCSYYREGKAHHFVELDLDGNVVRVM